MAIKFNRSQTFATNGTVDAPSLHNLVDGLDIYQSLITDQDNVTSVSTADELLIAIDAGSEGDAPKAVTVQELFQDALTAGTYTNANISEALSYGTATGTRLVSDNATITTGTITTGVIPSLTAGTTTSTAATITSGTVTNLASTTGTIATLNSTTGTIATLNSTTGTIPTLVATTLITTGTGTSASPAIVPTGDTNTGIFFPAADTLAATTNGTERLRIAPDGQIGIGGANYGTSGQVLTSNGTSSAPSWQLVSAITSGTAVASTSGTAIDFTGIPSWAKRITVMFNEVSISGTANILIRLGTSGGFESSGYESQTAVVNTASNTANSTAGFIIYGNLAAKELSGIMTISNLSGNIWTASGTFSSLGGTNSVAISGGKKQTSSVLDRIQILASNGTDTFDLGSINIMYEG